MIQIPYDSALDKLVVGNRGSNGLVMFENCCEESSSESSSSLSSFDVGDCLGMTPPRYITVAVFGNKVDYAVKCLDLRKDTPSGGYSMFGKTHTVRHRSGCQYERLFPEEVINVAFDFYGGRSGQFLKKLRGFAISATIYRYIRNSPKLSYVQVKLSAGTPFTALMEPVYKKTFYVNDRNDNVEVLEKSQIALENIFSDPDSNMEDGDGTVGSYFTDYCYYNGQLWLTGPATDALQWGFYYDCYTRLTGAIW